MNGQLWGPRFGALLFLVTFLVGGTGAHASGDIAFVERANPLPDVSGPFGVFGDYDGDGDPDLVFSGYSWEARAHVSDIFRNDGGVFAPIGLKLRDCSLDKSWAWGDADSDGDLDLFSSACGEDEDGAILFINQDGSFVPLLLETNVGSPLYLAAWRDYDGNGSLDLLLAHPYRHVGVVSLTGGQPRFSTIPGLIADPTLMEWADYDLDGDLDVFFGGARGRGGVLDLFRNDGGRFRETNELSRYAGFSWGDYDQDGDPDIATGFSNSYSGISLNSIQRNDDGHFVLVMDEDFGGGSTSWVDVDVDGDLDMVLWGVDSVPGRGAYRTKIRVAVNEGGAFSLADWEIDLGREVRGLEVADWDSDGDPDLLVFRGDESVFLENLSGGLVSLPTAPVDLIAVPGDGTVELTWGAATDGQTPSEALEYNVRMGTAPGGQDVCSPMSRPDGRRLLRSPGNAGTRKVLELNSLAPGTYYWSVQAIDQGGDAGPFAPEHSFEILPPPPLTARPIGEYPIATISGVAAWCDFDRDGDLDVLLNGEGVQSGVVEVYRSDGRLFVPLAASIRFFEGAAGVWVDRYRGGLPSFIMAGMVSGSTPETTSLYVSGWDAQEFRSFLDPFARAAISWVDVDNDGVSELFVSRMQDGQRIASTFEWFEKHLEWIEQPASIAPVLSGEAAWADIDGDGDMDLALAGEGEPMRIYLNERGKFVDSGNQLSWVECPTNVQWADDDADGDLDLLIAGVSKGDSFVAIFRNESGVFRQADVRFPGVVASDAAWGDLDLDGDPDLVIGSADEGRATVAYRNEAGQYKAIGWEFARAGSVDIELGDEDDDGDLDILFTGMSDGQPVALVYRNNLEVRRERPAPPTPTGESFEKIGVRRVLATLTWEPAPGTAAHGSGVSYNLRVGTESGAGDVFSPPPTSPDGLMAVPFASNASHSTRWTIELDMTLPYYWSVQAVDSASRGGPWSEERYFEIAVPVTAPAPPATTRLLGARPNPFNPHTVISYSMAAPGPVELTIYDLAGRRVKTVHAGTVDAGPHEVTWDGRDEQARRVASGVYLCRMEAGAYEDVTRLVLLK